MAEIKPQGVPQKKRNFKVIVDKDKCKSCLLCIAYCPGKHLECSKDLNKRGVAFAKIKDGACCSGCKMCALVCPDFCIEIIEE